MNGVVSIGYQPDPNLIELFRRCRPVFQALGDSARQDIILLLAHHDRLNVRQITEHMPLSRPTVSHHLRVLLDAGLVTVQREGTENYYVLEASGALNDLTRLIREVQACMADE